MSVAEGSQNAQRVGLVSSLRSTATFHQPWPSHEPPTARTRQLLLQFQRQKEIFIAKVYLVAVVFIALTLLQWFVLKTDVRLLQEVEHFLRRHVFVTNLVAILGMIVLSVFLFESTLGLRYSQPWTSIVSLLIVELFTVGFLDTVISSEIDSLIVTIFLTAAVFSALTLLADSISRDLSRDIPALSVVSAIFFGVTSIYLFLTLQFSIYFPTVVFTILLLLLVMFYVMYFAQIVFASGSLGVRLKDYMCASLMIYFNYIVLLHTALVLQVSLTA